MPDSTPLSKAEIAQKTKKMWFKAAVAGNIKTMKKLLESGFNIDTLDSDKNSALILACFLNKLSVVDFLINHKCNLDLQCVISHNAFHHPMTGAWISALATASVLGHLEAMKMLLNAGASVQNREKITIGKAENGAQYQAPIYQAVYGGHSEAIELLIKNGAEVNMKKIIDCTRLNGSLYNSGEIEAIINKIQTSVLKQNLEKEIKKENIQTYSKSILKI